MSLRNPLLPILLILAVLPANGQNKGFFQQSDEFFQDYVTDGLVKYELIAQNQQQLEQLCTRMAATDKPEQPSARKAFYINAYNLLAIQQVVDHYPVESPLAIEGFFDGITHTIHGQRVTLDKLEHELLFREFPDARLHFALICAAKGCPPMKPAAYQPERLDVQLEQQTREALSDSAFVRHQPGNRTVRLSPILNWYRDDFLQNAPSLLAYINQHRKKPLPADSRLRFYDYNWSLNDKPVEPANTQTAPDSISQDLVRQSGGYILDKGGVEVILFNNLYTQEQFFTASGETVKLNDRTSFYAGIVEALYGVGERVNLGFDAFYEGVRKGDEPLNTLAFDKSRRAHHALTGIMPKVKVAPFSSFQALTVESGLLIPTAKDPEADHHERPFLSNDDVEWWNAFFYVNNLSSDFQLFTEVSTIWRMDEAGAFSDQSAVRTPARIFLSWFPGGQWSLYGMGAYNPSWSGTGISPAFYQNGLGVKYQLTRTLEVEGLYTNFLLGQNSGAGQTFNLGLRFQR